ncbi:hypothetical protein [Actinomadura bangladeshensis]|uniref:Uncharacterized protein n=1 Tax=Actinomadura bangladeshensis TaxID=453573 RepID=A0A6L9QBW7_9ACTN|nr:hypothetical protein [Actinomadura bangladeshensis]NEA21576.1 hypothetical protein [Actinomadura bangladeshensis]NEA22536.1 hypothetical protein [Actinomadura bangladeshensis]
MGVSWSLDCPPLPRWTALPGDPAPLRRELARRQAAENPADEPTPPEPTPEEDR